MLLFVLALVPARASATSVFSMVFIGERLENGDTRAISLGGSQQLVGDSLSVLAYNPAELARATRVMIGATGQLGSDQGRNSSIAERDVSMVFPTFKVAFPFYKVAVLSVGYVGRYNPDGSFLVEDETGAGVTYIQRRTFSGGLFSVPFTAAFNVTRFASVGLTYAIEGGFVEERWDTQFGALLYVPGAGFKKENVNASSYGGGVVLRPLRRVMLGGTWESQIDYDSDIGIRYTQSEFDTTYSSSATLPSRWTLAATVGLTRYLRVAGSYYSSDFSKFSGFSLDTSSLRKEISLSLGIEWDDVIPTPFFRMPLRASFNYQQLPFDFPAGSDVTRTLFGLGSGFVLGGGKGKLDFGLQIGKTGSVDKNTIEDRLVRLYFSITGSEDWRRRGIGSGEIGR